MWDCTSSMLDRPSSTTVLIAPLLSFRSGRLPDAVREPAGDQPERGRQRERQQSQLPAQVRRCSRVEHDAEQRRHRVQHPWRDQAFDRLDVSERRDTRSPVLRRAKKAGDSRCRWWKTCARSRTGISPRPGRTGKRRGTTRHRPPRRSRTRPPRAPRTRRDHRSPTPRR
ncbi:hypothetical protein FHX42_003618 [Saccharopolyspora lacisalsi]|uniref:Uncharacterized protein n=1 Tax=Halosaccharopolyspora lacisalsi TaxID=1000566 RepID=A0A839DWA4_9PSEU|nr:hypothetical protein [Halosaccharopolyspora lacisalsi]